MTKVIEKSALQQQDEENIGSMRWKAPETFGATPHWSDKADMFSLGVTLWELFTRQVPFASITNSEMVKQAICTGQRPVVPESCPPTYARMLTWCWNQVENERPTAQVLLEYMMKHEKEFVSTG